MAGLPAWISSPAFAFRAYARGIMKAALSLRRQDRSGITPDSLFTQRKRRAPIDSIVATVYEIYAQIARYWHDFPSYFMTSNKSAPEARKFERNTRSSVSAAMYSKTGCPHSGHWRSICEQPAPNRRIFDIPPRHSPLRVAWCTALPVNGIANTNQR